MLYCSKPEEKIGRLLELLASEKRWHEILEWAGRWISLANGPETAYRKLMIAYDALGDRARMASDYEQCVQVLRELDLEPSEETRALVFTWFCRNSLCQVFLFRKELSKLARSLESREQAVESVHVPSPRVHQRTEQKLHR